MSNEIIVALIALVGTIVTAGLAYRKAGQASSDAKSAQESMPILKGFESVIKTLEAENMRLKSLVEKLEEVIETMKRKHELELDLCKKQVAGLESERDALKAKIAELDITIKQLHHEKDALIKKLKLSNEK